MTSRSTARAKKVSIKLRAANQPSDIKVRCPRQRLQQYAMKWRYTVLNRHRWYRSGKARSDLHQDAFDDARALGFSARALQYVARAGTIELQLPRYHDEEKDWEARVMPWEYFLSAATRSTRDGRSLTILRRMSTATKGTHVRKPSSPPLFVESAPGELSGRFQFNAEFDLFTRYLSTGGKLPAPRKLPNPSAGELRRTIRRGSHEIIHLAGFDAHEGASLLEVQDTEPDGYYLRGRGGKAAVETALDMARNLNISKERKWPLLVAFNLHNSASRLAALAVGQGARAAIGFQTTVDDALAELFFAQFYRVWALTEFRDLPYAFESALEELRRKEDRSSLRGTGIVLWSQRPLVHRRKAEHRVRLSRQFEEERTEDPSRVIAPVRERISFDIRPKAMLNYSSLHNNGDLFDAFILRKTEPATISGLEIRVVLHVGTAQFPYAMRYDLEQYMDDLKEKIRVPLTWQYVNTLKESIRTSVTTSVTHNNETLYHQTESVVLLPVEEWKDNDIGRKWLPSFVLPRDPAVSHIVSLAQGPLKAIRDDLGAGFDGYQQLKHDFEVVDHQVQALWMAILRELKLSYINPPPSYADFSQRLRSPSEILRTRTGTCIDLSLLLAACLEYVEIYPVIFLHEDHAYPGYWATGESQMAFQRPVESADRSGDEQHRGMSGTAGSKGWVMASDAFGEVKKLVEDDVLIPIESTLLAEGRGFQEAWLEGKERLDKKEFHSLQDILTARSDPWLVTPLPLVCPEDNR